MKAMKSLGTEILFLAFMVGIGVLSRVIPHPWNFTAMGAMAVFSGFAVRTHKGLLFVPFLSLLISDLALGFYEGAVWVYAGFAITMLMSVGYFRQRMDFSFKGRALSVAALSLVSSFVFFLITNFGAWQGNPLYAQNISGLMASYVAGLPFLFNQMGGDLFYGAMIFGVYEYLTASTQNDASQAIFP